MSRLADIAKKVTTTVEPPDEFDEDGAVARRLPKGKRPPARIHAPRLLFIASTVALLCIGLVMVYSASSIEGLVTYGDPAHFFKRQAAFLVLATICCVVLAVIPYDIWSGRLGYLALVVIILALIAVALFGDTRLGSTRWITIAGFDFQPSEFAKIAIVLVSAGLQVRLVEQAMSVNRYLVGILCAVAVPLALILLQPDMGTAVIAGIGFLAVLWFGGTPISLFKWIFLAVIVIAIIAVIAAPYRVARFMAAFNAEADPQDSGYQLINSLYALGSGGFFGLGLGNSRQKFFYLPESHNDFIFAVIGEELGFFGCIIVVALFVIFIWSGLRIARNASTMYGTLLAAACTTLVGSQAFINILQTIGLFPVTGKPLPFISYGGSSLLASLILVGFVLSVSFHSNVSASEVRRDGLHILGGGQGAPQQESLGGRRDWANRGMDATAREDVAYDDESFESVRVVKRTGGRTRWTYSQATEADRGRVISFDRDAEQTQRSSDGERSSQDARPRRNGRSSRRR